jgi:hypothetical protein
VLEVIDRRHDYTLAGSTESIPADDEEEVAAGTIAAVRFRLNNVVRDRTLRDGSVLAVDALTVDAGTSSVMQRPAFLERSQKACV